MVGCAAPSRPPILFWKIREPTREGFIVEHQGVSRLVPWLNVEPLKQDAWQEIDDQGQLRHRLGVFARPGLRLYWMMQIRKYIRTPGWEIRDSFSSRHRTRAEKIIIGGVMLIMLSLLGWSGWYVFNQFLQRLPGFWSASAANRIDILCGACLFAFVLYWLISGLISTSYLAVREHNVRALRLSASGLCAELEDASRVERPWSEVIQTKRFGVPMIVFGNACLYPLLLKRRTKVAIERFMRPQDRATRQPFSPTFHTIINHVLPHGSLMFALAFAVGGPISRQSGGPNKLMHMAAFGTLMMILFTSVLVWPRVSQSRRGIWKLCRSLRALDLANYPDPRPLTAAAGTPPAGSPRSPGSCAPPSAAAPARR
jgi:hypothetical protein